jgi:hypothetical protein
MTFDSSSNAARELLALFGKNTAVRIDHKYGQATMYVVVARTGNVLASVLVCDDLEQCALAIMGMKNFPRPRNMKRSWSPIRLNSNAQAMMNADSGIRFA